MIELTFPKVEDDKITASYRIEGGYVAAISEQVFVDGCQTRVMSANDDGSNSKIHTGRLAKNNGRLVITQTDEINTFRVVFGSESFGLVEESGADKAIVILIDVAKTTYNKTSSGVKPEAVELEGWFDKKFVNQDKLVAIEVEGRVLISAKSIGGKMVWDVQLPDKLNIAGVPTDISSKKVAFAGIVEKGLAAAWALMDVNYFIPLAEKFMQFERSLAAYRGEPIRAPHTWQIS
jgi:hypothetical protein